MVYLHSYLDVGSLSEVSASLTKAEENQTMYKVSAWVAIVLTVVVTVVIMFMKKNVRVAVAIMKEASAGSHGVEISLFPAQPLELERNVFWNYLRCCLAACLPACMISVVGHIPVLIAWPIVPYLMLVVLLVRTVRVRCQLRYGYKLGVI